MKKGYLIGAIVIFICCAVSGSAQTAKEYKFIYEDKNGTTEKISLFLKTDTIQYQYQRGVRFSIRLKNNSTDSIIIRNPLDVFNLSLMNDSGHNVLYPHFSRIYTHASTFKLESFSIESVIINGETYNIDMTAIKTITIPTKGNFEIFFKITDILKNGATVPYTPSQKTEILYGRYTLLISMGIVEGKSPYIFSINPVTLLYTQCL